MQHKTEQSVGKNSEPVQIEAGRTEIDLYQHMIESGLPIEWITDEQKAAEQQAATVAEAQGYIVTELAAADVEINKIEDGHSRAKGDLAVWRKYRNALRDYVQGGEVVGEKPLRPQP